MSVLVATSEFQTLAFFDVPAMVARASAGDIDIDDELVEQSRREQRALELRYELHILEQNNLTKARAREAEASLDYMRNSRSWRMTAPLRRLDSVWRRF